MLPTQKTPAKLNLHEFTVLQYGPTKYGKSSWCAQAEGAVFLATEPGLNSLEVYQQPINTWEDLLSAAKDLADGNHAFRTVIIDTVDNAYRMCADFVNKKAKVEHESELEYGKGYALVNSEFYRVLNKLALLPYGLFLISHSQEKEIETRTGKSTKTIPTLPDKARKLVLGLVDVILFCDFEPVRDAEGNLSHKRVLRTKPTARYEAGDRTGRLPETIEFDYAAFVAAFQQGVPAATKAAPPPQAVAGSAVGAASAGTTTRRPVEPRRGAGTADGARARSGGPRSPPPQAPGGRPVAAPPPGPPPKETPGADLPPSPQPAIQSGASTPPPSPSAGADTSRKEGTP